MFTGIVAAVGTIDEVRPADRGVRVTVGCATLALDDLRTGDSVAVDGVCLTVVGIGDGTLGFDVSQETIECTRGFAPGCRVNLEKALRLADRLGGHLVSGHVDGIGTVREFVAAGESRTLTIEAPVGLAKYLAPKGSIAVNGVSLTVNAVDRGTFSMNLIPHTLATTNLQQLVAGAPVNIEIDLIARYVERILSASGSVRQG